MIAGDRAGQRIQRFLGTRNVSQRAEYGANTVGLIGRAAQSVECRKHRIDRGLEPLAHAGQFIGPAVELLACRAQIVIRRPGSVHHRAEVRRMKMARDEAERLQRPQQRRQQGRRDVR